MVLQFKERGIEEEMELVLRLWNGPFMRITFTIMICQ